ncbi:MAG: radical SAM protein [Tissierellia bacterium]|nr:radical SAM protein [Tissierellia bacterium]
MKKKIEFLILKLTENCNLKCNYCFELLKRKTITKRDINTKKYKGDFLDEIICKNIVLTGGEPFLNDNINYYIEKFSNSNVTILTNGIFKPNLPIDVLKKINIVISLDGDFRIMNSHRNINNEQFKKIISNIKFYIKNCKSVTINILVTKKSINGNWNYAIKKYKNQVAYKVSTPSLIFTPETYKLDQEDKYDLKNKIINTLDLFNYRIKCSSDLFSKEAFLSNYTNNIERLINLEYNVQSNILSIFNRNISNIKEVEKVSNIIKRDSDILFKNFLLNKSDLYTFNPFCILENYIYRGTYG